MSLQPVHGSVIGKPFQGTHGQAFNAAGGSDNWESENAYDISTPVGSPVYAVADGTIGSQIGSLGQGGRFAGQRLHLVTSGNDYYYAHLSRILVNAGQKVKAGAVIGYSGEANGVAHLHFAAKTGDPLRGITPAGSKGTGGGTFGVGSIVSAPLNAINWLGDLGAKAGDETAKIANQTGDEVLGAAGSLAGDVAKALLNVLIDAFGDEAARIGLYLVLLGGGIALAYQGVNQLTSGGASDALAGVKRGATA